MKKFFFAMIAIAIAGIFAGCSDEEVKQVDNRPILRVRTNSGFPPYEFKDGEEIVGMEIDIVRKAADKLGMKVVLVDGSFGTIVDDIAAGKADVGAAALTITEERLKYVNFSTSYDHASQIVLVREDSSIGSVEQLKATNALIGCLRGTSGEKYITAHLLAGKDPSKDMMLYPTASKLTEALLGGEIGVAVFDEGPAYVALSKNRRRLRQLPIALTNEKYAFAVTPGRTNILNALNDVIQELGPSGIVSLKRKNLIRNSEIADR